jgi:hypothetical protein
MKYHSFRNKRWRIEHKGIKGRWGECENPDAKDKVLVLPKLHHGSKVLMEVAIHEGLHACLWDLNEEPVHDTARDISSFLWRLGFRHISQEGIALNK